MSENRTEVILAVAKAYEDENTALINKIENIVIKKKPTLPKELQEVLDKIGNTPLDEPEIFNAKSVHKTIRVVMGDLNIDDFSAADVSNLTKEAYIKVSSIVDDDGYYKTTPAIDKVKLPKTTEIEQLVDCAKLHVDEATDPDKAQQEIENKIFEIAGVDKNTLTDWEKEVVTTMTYSYMEAVASNTISEASDFTPFAKYLKN